jgi:hypothetical protein
MFGPPLPYGALMFLGALAGALFGVDMKSMLEPFMYILPAAWFFQVFIKIWKMLRYSREHSWPFVLGLSGEQRLELCRAVLYRSVKEFLPFSAACLTSFFLVRSFAQHEPALKKVAEGVALFAIEAGLFYLALFSAIRWRVIEPKKKDRARIALPLMLTRLMHVSTSAVSNAIGAVAGRVLPGNVAVLLRRQSLYLLRMDFFSLILFPPLALAFAIILLVFCKGPLGYVGEAAALLAPFLLMIDRTHVFDESVGKILACPYYRVAGKDLLSANFCIAASACAPFLIAFVAVRIIDRSYGTSELLFHGAAMIAGTASSALFMANRWLRPEWDGPQAAMGAITVVCCLLGCAIPHWGMVFPLLYSAGMWRFSFPVMNPGQIKAASDGPEMPQHF